MKTSAELTLQNILQTVAEYQASDVHLTIGNPPILRIDTKLVPLNDFPPLTEEFLFGMLDVFLTEEQKETLKQQREIIVSYPFLRQGRFRVNIFYQRGTIAASLRYISGKMVSLKELGLPSSVERLADTESGLIIISGPFGSGRSTTLAAIISAINKKKRKFILTIEKPIEYLFQNEKSIIEQREVGRDTPSHEDALHAVSEEDVNVVMISDLGSSEVIQAAVSLALSGRLVIGAMDTDSAVKSVDKMLTTCPTAQRSQAQADLSEALQGVVCQRLVPRIGGGNIMVAEILLTTSAARNVIHSGNIDQLHNIIQTSRDDGMISLDHSLAQLVRTGEVNVNEAVAAAHDHEGMALLAQAL